MKRRSSFIKKTLISKIDQAENSGYMTKKQRFYYYFIIIIDRFEQSQCYRFGIIEN